jgi:Tfp pilus assembly protein PilO
MASSEGGDRRSGVKGQLLERLHDPLQLRIVVLGFVLLIGYGAVYMPLDEKIVTTGKKIEQEKKLGNLADKLEQLQTQCGKFTKLLPQQTDKKEWLQYMLEGIRQFPMVTLTKLDSLPARAVGPYQAAVLQIEAIGSYYDLDMLLRWLEGNPRLLRVDAIAISTRGDAKQEKDIVAMRLTVLGLGG